MLAKNRRLCFTENDQGTPQGVQPSEQTVFIPTALGTSYDLQISFAAADEDFTGFR
ncbi:hypothetical protein GCM10007898_04280 [Dyella flagellata]|uniref:Uncharacterized protein n=1 Tax=Dyella flagellata TaxID=1867833 RepID=A0ABQ5X6J4_9GAMM|nr:hypothetical protein GCM10007898_04280 [Dyella flagellata]